MINYNYTYRADTVQRNPTTRGPTDVLGHHGQNDQQARGRPGYLSDHSRVAAIDRRGGGDPSQDRLDVPTEEGPSIMSLHNDRCTSKATVSPDQDQDQPDMAIATF